MVAVFFPHYYIYARARGWALPWARFPRLIRLTRVKKGEILRFQWKKCGKSFGVSGKSRTFALAFAQKSARPRAGRRRGAGACFFTDWNRQVVREATGRPSDGARPGVNVPINPSARRPRRRGGR